MNPLFATVVSLGDVEVPLDGAFLSSLATDLEASRTRGLRGRCSDLDRSDAAAALDFLDSATRSPTFEWDPDASVVGAHALAYLDDPYLLEELLEAPVSGDVEVYDAALAVLGAIRAFRLDTT